MYTAISKLGTGGFGTILLCNNNETGKRVAAKFVHVPGRGHTNYVPKSLEEIDSTRRVQSGGLTVEMLDVVTLDDITGWKGLVPVVSPINVKHVLDPLVIILKLYEGSLENIEITTSEHFTDLIIQMLTIVNWIHSCNMAWTELKPGNFLYYRDETGKICIVGADLGGATYSLSSYTYMYPSPRVFQSAIFRFGAAYGQISDIWSLGMNILFYSLRSLECFNPDIFNTSDTNLTGWENILQSHPAFAGSKLLLRNEPDRVESLARLLEHYRPYARKDFEVYAKIGLEICSRVQLAFQQKREFGIADLLSEYPFLDSETVLQINSCRNAKPLLYQAKGSIRIGDTYTSGELLDNFDGDVIPEFEDRYMELSDFPDVIDDDILAWIDEDDTVKDGIYVPTSQRDQFYFEKRTGKVHSYLLTDEEHFILLEQRLEIAREMLPILRKFDFVCDLVPFFMPRMMTNGLIDYSKFDVIRKGKKN
jgi:serine/threonine protein kinase